MFVSCHYAAPLGHFSSLIAGFFQDNIRDLLTALRR